MRNKVVIIKKELIPFIEESTKDFQSVLNQHADYAKLVKQYYLTGGLILIAILFSGFLLYSDSDPITEKVPEMSYSSDLSPAFNSNYETPQSYEILTVYDSLKRLSIKRKKVNETRSNKPLNVKPLSIDERLNRAAEPVKGFSYLYEYLNTNISYPEIHQLDSIEGIVKISFTVKKDSTISKISIIESLGENFDSEAIRLIKNMPKWRPAIHNGKAINQRLSIPIRFNYKNDE